MSDEEEDEMPSEEVEDPNMPDAASRKRRGSITEGLDAAADMGGEKKFDVTQTHWKGKKMNGKKLPERLTLAIGTMGVKVMNGEMPVESMLMQNLVSWESVDDTFKLTVKGKTPKDKETTINFGTVYGTEICETMLSFAKELARVKKQQAVERKAADEEKKRKKEMEAELEAQLEDEPEQDQASAWKNLDDMAGEKSFEVGQTYWKGKKIKGKKISEEVILSVSQSSIKVLDGQVPVTSFLIQNLMSWETVENKFRLTLKPEKTGGQARHIDFATNEGREITETLLAFAKDLARVKKQQKVDKKKREEEAAAAAKLAAKLAPKVIAQGKLEEVVTNLYLETFTTWRNENIPRDIYSVFGTPSIQPSNLDKKPISEVLAEFAKQTGAEEPKILSVWAMAKSSMPDAKNIIELLSGLAWSKADEGQEAIIELDDLMLMMETFAEAEATISEVEGGAETAGKFAETASLALCTLIGTDEKFIDMVVTEGGISLALSWLEKYQADIGVSRKVSMLMALLMSGKEAPVKLDEIEGGFVKYLDAVEAHTPALRPPEDDIDATSTLYQNPIIMPSIDVLEKLALGLYFFVRKSPATREKAMSSGIITKVFAALMSAPTSLVCARLISGVLNTLIEVEEDDDPLAEEVEEDVEGRLQAMIDEDIIKVLVHCMQHNMSDFGLAGTAVLVIQMMRDKKIREAYGEELVAEAGIFVNALQRFAARRSRGPQPFALALVILSVSRMCYDADAKETFVSLGSLPALLSIMAFHKNERMIAESSFITIHALTDKLPEDVHIMLPSYLGISDEDVQESALDDDDEEGPPKKYKVIRKAALRASFDLDSDQVGILEAGDVIDVIQQRENENGQMRVECKQGWTSVQSRDGNTLMVRESDDDESTADKLLVKAQEVMAQLFRPLKQFPKDEAMVEATFFAARTLLSKADLLKKAVGKGTTIKVMLRVAGKHSKIPGVAENLCATVSNITRGNKANIKRVKEVGGVKILYEMLEAHQGNARVMKQSFHAIRNLITIGEVAREFNNFGALDCIDAAMKQHSGSGNKDLLETGLNIRNKLQKVEKKATKASPRAAPSGRRASISIFAKVETAAKPKIPGTTSDSSQDPEQSKEEADAFELLNSMMNTQMFDVKQNHIKNSPKQVQLQVGDMGITFYDKDMKPVDSILYQTLRSWNSRPGKDVSLVLTTPDGEKEVVLKTADGEQIARQMETKARALAVEHKARKKKAKADAAADAAAARTDEPEAIDEGAEEEEEEDDDDLVLEDDPEKALYYVTQSHLQPGSPEKVSMQIGKEGVAFRNPKLEGLGDALEIVQWREIASFSAEEGKVSCTLVDESRQPVVLGSESNAEAIVKTMADSKPGEDEEEEEEEDDDEPASEDVAETILEEEESEEEEEESDEESDEEDEPLSEHYTVSQVHFRGERDVELNITRSGLTLTDAGKEVGKYEYASIQSWFEKRASSVTVLIGMGVGLVTDYTFNTSTSDEICQMLDVFATSSSAGALAIRPPGSEPVATDGSAATTAAAAEEEETPAAVKELKEKLKVVQFQNNNLSEQLKDLQETSSDEANKMKQKTVVYMKTLKDRHAAEMAKLTGGNDVATALQEQLATANEKFDTDMKEKDDKLERAVKFQETEVEKLTEKYEKEIDELKASGSSGESAQFQQQMQKAKQMMMRLKGDGDKAKAEVATMKKRLMAARDAMMKKVADYETKLAESGDRIVELEKIAVEQGKGDDVKKAADLAAANTKAAAGEADIVKAKYEKKVADIKQQLDVANAALEAVKAKGGGGGGDSVVQAQLTAEIAVLKPAKEALDVQVEKLKANGEKAMGMLKTKVQEAAVSKKEMDAMKLQREKETALVKRAMGELKNLRETVAARDKTINANTAKTKAIMDRVAVMKQGQGEEVEKLKAKQDQAVREVRAKMKAEADVTINAQKVSIEDLTARLEEAESKAASAEVQEKIESMTGAIAILRQSEAKIREKMDELRADLTKDIPKVVNACHFTVDAIMQKYTKEAALRRKLYNELQELKGNIRVYCRCRPFLEFESVQGFTDIIVPGIEGEMQLVDPESKAKKSYEFDRFFKAGTTQAAVYEETNPLVQSVCDGYNVCIFAYGQTGSGKTFTMMGSPDEPGVNMRALNELFRLKNMKAKSIKILVELSFLEIYCDEINDLLVPIDKRTKMEVKNEPKGGIYVPNLTIKDVNNVGDVMQVMELGTKNRAASATKMNQESSRSHCVLAAKIICEDLNSGDISIGKLNLIDLAGSERLKRSGVEGQALKEAISINSSLSALGDVISNLGKGSKHIPYRNSKLTHLLSDSLSGDSKCLMFLNISPSSSNHGETGNSLLFGTRCRKVELGQAKKSVTKGKRASSASTD